MVSAGLGALAFALALAAPGQARADSQPSCPDASLTATSGTLDRVDAAAFCLINAKRTERGLRAFNRSPQLNESSAFQSNDMVAHHYFAHDYPGRPTLLNRVLWTGYFANATDGLYAENLGYGPQETTTAQVIVDAWMSSPDHESNILDPRLHDIGLGAALAPPDPAFYPDHPAVVFTTDFGMRVVAASARGCNAPPASSPQSDPGAASGQSFCSARRRAHPRRHHRRKRHATVASRQAQRSVS